MSEASCDIGLIGLAVMGQNLVLNMNDHGYKVAVFNRTISKVDEFIAHEAKGTNVVGAHSVKEFIAMLKRPRRVMLSGLDALTPSERRVAELAARGLTTRQVAEALFVTPKTVEFHLRHTYQKLDINSRDQLAAMLIEPQQLQDR